MTSREEFEAWFKSRFWHECYEDIKDHLFDSWQASRAALVIELPIRQSIEKDTGLGYNCAIHHCRESIEAAGVQVKP